MDPGVTIPDSPYAVQLARGFRGLRFAPALEREFEAEFLGQHLPRMRMGLAAAAALYLVFLLLRLRFETGPAESWGLFLRSTALAGLLLPLAASYWPRLHAFHPLIAPTGYAIFAVALTGLEIGARRYGIERRYEFLIFASFHVYVFGGLLLRPALAAGACVVLAYAIGGLAGGLTGREWAWQLLFIGLANLVGGGALYASERTERENYLRRQLYSSLAVFDGLTGLVNRLAFASRAETLVKQAAREGRPLGLAMIDVDHFKAYNDRYGHVEGDVCLKQVAQALREEFRRPLDLLGRFGGEEFVGLWFDVQPDAVRSMAEQVRAAVQACRITHAVSQSGRVTVSVGAVACVPEDGETLMALVQRADRALYEAKERGRNRVVLELRSSGAAAVATRGRRAPTVSAG